MRERQETMVAIERIKRDRKIYGCGKQKRKGEKDRQNPNIYI